MNKILLEIDKMSDCWFDYTEDDDVLSLIRIILNNPKRKLALTTNNLRYDAPTAWHAVVYVTALALSDNAALGTIVRDCITSV